MTQLADSGIGDLRKFLDLGPVGAPAVGNPGEGRAAVGVDGEQPKLELVGVPHRIGGRCQNSTLQVP